MTDLVHRLRTACSPESPLGKLCSEAADALAGPDQGEAEHVGFVSENDLGVLAMGVSGPAFISTKLSSQHPNNTIPLYRIPIIASLEQRIAEAERVIAFLNAHVNLELTWGEIDGWEDDCQWRVHSVNGGRNDREWTLIGHGETVELAVIAAEKWMEAKDENHG